MKRLLILLALTLSAMPASALTCAEVKLNDASPLTRALTCDSPYEAPAVGMRAAAVAPERPEWTHTQLKMLGALLFGVLSGCVLYATSRR